MINDTILSNVLCCDLVSGLDVGVGEPKSDRDNTHGKNSPLVGGVY